jgi:hypothetical protein
MPKNFSSDNPFWLYLIFATSILPGIIAAEIIVMSELYGFSGKKFNWNTAVYASGFSYLISVISAIIALTMSPGGISGVVAWVVNVIIAPVLGSLAGIIFGNYLNFIASIASTAAIVGLFVFISMPGSNLGLLVVTSVVLIFVICIYIVLNAAVCFFVFKFTIKLLIYAQRERGVYKIDAAKIAFLTAGFWTSLGVAFKVFLKFKNQIDFVDTREFIGVASLSLASLAVTAIPLLDLIVFKPKRIIDQYRKSERNLIKP